MVESLGLFSVEHNWAPVCTGVTAWRPSFILADIPCQWTVPVYSTVMKPAYVYIMASRRNGTIYVGVTTDLIQRVAAHREGLVPGFTAKYGVKQLVYFEHHACITEAIVAEKRWKNRRRQIKVRMIERVNPSWGDLYEDLLK